LAEANGNNQAHLAFCFLRENYILMIVPWAKGYCAFSALCIDSVCRRYFIYLCGVFSEIVGKFRK